MGTRGVYGFRKGGVDKTTYNHCDSYPDGLGSDVVRFLANTPVQELNEIFDRIEVVDGGTPARLDQIAECKQWANTDVSSRSLTEWYVLLRNAQGDLLAFKQGLKYMIDSNDFIKESLFCEWGYIINLDENVLEVYKGFQDKPQDNRYRIDEPNDGYYNCKLVGTLPLEGIAENWQPFLSKLREEGDD